MKYGGVISAFSSGGGDEKKKPSRALRIIRWDACGTSFFSHYDKPSFRKLYCRK